MGRPSYDLFVTRTAPGFPDYTVAVSSTDTYYSNPMSPGPDGTLGFEVRFTGTPTGTLTLWYSDDPEPSVADDTDWIQDTSWSPTNPAGAAIKNKYTVTGVKGRRARLKYVNASGTGTIAGRAVV